MYKNVLPKTVKFIYVYNGITHKVMGKKVRVVI